jgi:hypothetical protein
MYKYILLAFFILITLPFQVSSREEAEKVNFQVESEKIELGLENTKTIRVKGYHRHNIVRPELFKVNIKADELEFTAVKYGKTTVYIWDSNGLKTYYQPKFNF